MTPIPPSQTAPRPDAERREAPGDMRERPPQQASLRERLLARVRNLALGLWGFWNKIMNDWILNLAGLLAYNLLMSSFPILLVLLAIGGFLLNSLAPSVERQFATKIANTLPGGAHGAGGTVVTAATYSLTHSAGILLIFGIVSSIFLGSGLFIVLENCFGIIFKLRGRPPIIQNLVAIGMLLFYVLLVPFVLLAAIIPSTIVRSLPLVQQSSLSAFFFQVLGVAVSAFVSLILFGTIYLVVPNRRVRVREIWRGTLVASGLLVLYEALFPVYVSTFLHPRNYGSSAGFALVILLFFYYLAFILLLGAEINSWAMGQREMAGDIVAVLHEVQAHNTTRGAAGPTAGSPAEDVMHHEGAAAMRDTLTAVTHEREQHGGDAQPEKYAESGVQRPGYSIETDEELAQVERQAHHGQDGHQAEHTGHAQSAPRAAETSAVSEMHPSLPLPTRERERALTISRAAQTSPAPAGRQGLPAQAPDVRGGSAGHAGGHAGEQQIAHVGMLQPRQQVVAIPALMLLSALAGWLVGRSRGPGRDASLFVASGQGRCAAPSDGET